jgi:hypothetical protein
VLPRRAIEVLSRCSEDSTNSGGVLCRNRPDQWGRASSPRAAGRAQILHAAESGMCVTSYPYRLITGRVPQGLTIFRITQRHFAILRSRLNPNAA